MRKEKKEDSIVSLPARLDIEQNLDISNLKKLRLCSGKNLSEN